MTMMDRLNRRGALFLDWASAVFGDGERRGRGNCRKIARHPPVDRCCSAQQPLCLCLDGMAEMVRQAHAITRPDQPPTGFAGAHFPPVTSSPVRAIRPSVEPAPLVLLPSLGVRGGTGLQGLGSLEC